jgi:hypothetical protein
MRYKGYKIEKKVVNKIVEEFNLSEKLAIQCIKGYFKTLHNITKEFEKNPMTNLIVIGNGTIKLEKYKNKY